MICFNASSGIDRLTKTINCGGAAAVVLEVAGGSRNHLVEVDRASWTLRKGGRIESLHLLTGSGIERFCVGNDILPPAAPPRPTEPRRPSALGRRARADRNQRSRPPDGLGERRANPGKSHRSGQRVMKNLRVMFVTLTTCSNCACARSDSQNPRPQPGSCGQHRAGMVEAPIGEQAYLPLTVAIGFRHLNAVL